MQRLRAVVSGADADAVLVENAATSCGWTPARLKLTTPARSSALAAHRSSARQLRQALERVAGQHLLVRANSVQADAR